MKRRKFIAKTSLFTITSLTTLPLMAAGEKKEKAQIYEMRIYTLQFGGNQNILHTYLKSALIPALNKQGIKNVGAFTPIGDPMPSQLYLLIAYDSYEQMLKSKGDLGKDEEYMKNKKAYDENPPEKKAYERFDTYLMQAFEAIPQMKLPESKERIFEIRTYQGYNEHAVERKVKMFNKEEMPVFYETGLHPVFFGDMISGPEMPALIYMLWFKDMKERDENWAKFSVNPEWKRMSALPEYANSVSNIIRVFLKPTEYSQV